MSVCVQCKKGEMREDERARYTRTVAGHSFVVLVPARVCDECGAISYAGPALERAVLLIAQELVRRGESSGEAVRFLRKALGLKARELAELLGVTPDTVSRWETGRSPLDRATMNTLGGLVSDQLSGRQDTLSRLQGLRAPKPRGQAVELRLEPVSI